ncbi:MAG: sigma-70 family RNA polymerase sigma factor, partial [Cyanobacteria bacterium]|nr:sigma-70 family RNA polymerase sigma factor [Cyanobacteriota bacterium]
MKVTSDTRGSAKENLRTLATEALVELAQKQGSNTTEKLDALEVLVHRYQKTVYATLYQLAPERNDIADLTQEVLLKMCRSIGALRNPKTFKFWLNRIITNLFYDELRKIPRKLPTVSMDAPMYDDELNSSSASLTHDIADKKEVPDEKLLGGELDQKIKAAIQNLPEQFRTMIVLREIQGLSYEEIASLTNCNLGTVKSRLAR